MFRTVKSKFIALSLIMIVLSVGIPMAFLLNQVSQNFHERSVLMIEAAIDLMIDGLNTSMMKGDEKNVQNVVEQIANRTSIDHIRIFNNTGIINYSDDSTEIGSNINIIEPGHIEEEISNITDWIVDLDKKKNNYKAIIPIMVEERCQSCHADNAVIAYLDVDTDFTKAEVKFYTGSFHMLFLGAVLIFVLALSFYLIFNKYINRPLNKFIEALDAVESGNLNKRLPLSGKDEFSKLNYHYNKMVNELNYSREKINEMHFEQLQRADKMMNLGELTASMAHDINNYSAIIMSRADFLLFESASNNQLKKFNEDLFVINNQIEKISKITGNILKHSKKTSNNFSNFDLVQLVENSSNILEPLIKKRKAYLIREIKLNKAIIFGDSNQIEQVIMNLISNALDAIKEGGEIKIILQITNNKKFQLLVKDNGIGIEKEAMGKIFSPFYTKKPSDKGTGLGLYIVENICKTHNAKLECESKVNVGTIFTVTFSGEITND